MVNTNVIYSLGEIVLSSKKRRKPLRVKPEKELEDYQLVEEYEGTCEDCLEEKTQPKCPMCETD